MSGEWLSSRQQTLACPTLWTGQWLLECLRITVPAGVCQHQAPRAGARQWPGLSPYE